jgi:hypothetical protein
LERRRKILRTERRRKSYSILYIEDYYGEMWMRVLQEGKYKYGKKRDKGI